MVDERKEPIYTPRAEVRRIEELMAMARWIVTRDREACLLQRVGSDALYESRRP